MPTWVSLPLLALAMFAFYAAAFAVGYFWEPVIAWIVHRRRFRRRS